MTRGTYAADTSVSSDASRAEIERTLTRYGADQFIYGWDRENAIIGFRLNNRQVKFFLPLPDRDSDEFWKTPTRGTRRSTAQAIKEYEKAVRQKWRALALVVKAKLEAVESEITTFDEEFLAHIVLPNGETAGSWMTPQVEEAYRTGTMPELLPKALPAGSED